MPPFLFIYYCSLCSQIDHILEVSYLVVQMSLVKIRGEEEEKRKGKEREGSPINKTPEEINDRIVMQTTNYLPSVWLQGRK